MIKEEYTEDLEDNLSHTVEFESVFLDRESQLKRALRNISDGYDSKHTEEILFKNLNVALSGCEEKEDADIGEAVLGFLRVIFLRKPDVGSTLSDLGASNEFIKFTLNCIIEFGAELERHNLKDMRGDNWWSFIDTNRILDDEEIRHQHIATIDRSEKVTIDSTPFADWILIRHLLDENLDTYKLMGEDGVEEVDVAEFKRVRAIIYYLENELSNEGIEFENEESIIENLE